MYGTFQRLQLSEIDEQQVSLSERYISPNIQIFEKAFCDFRKEVDEIWKAGFSSTISAQKNSFLKEKIEQSKKKLFSSEIAAYPVGICYPLSEIAFQFLMELEVHDPKSVFYSLREFLEKGGIIKVIWGEVRHEFFQTSLQIGEWCVDVANDTVDVKKPKVVCFKLTASDCPFHEVLSIEQYVQIKRSYHDCTIYVNTIFPHLFPYFPLLVLQNKDGKISLDTSICVLDLTLSKGYDFVFSSLFQPLPKEVFERISIKVDRLRAKYQYAELLECRNCALEELAKLSVAQVLTDKATMTKVKATVKYINFMVNAL
ncbi:MAG: hypothetical protein NT150_15355 [Bacteroidetes bacterium]|nr:hypothetical protein [Bacteroidota bacterium]